MIKEKIIIVLVGFGVLVTVLAVLAGGLYLKSIEYKANKIIIEGCKEIN